VVDFSIDEAGALADTSFSGIIGADLLYRFHVVLDYARSQMFLEKNRFFADPFEFDMSGIRFMMEGARFEVLKVFSVFDGSPAALAGIREGDVVSAIDGREAHLFTREALRNYMERHGAKVRLTVERNGKTQDVEIVLKRQV
jgi:C-terminal processing protease CtpA/Prc